MKINEFRYILDESVSMLWRRKTANLISVIIMGLSLLILVVFLMVTLNIAGFIDKTSKETRMYVYLDEGLDEERSREIQVKLLSETGVEEVVFISREEALVDFRETLGEGNELLDALDSNPLPDAYRLKLKEGYVSSGMMDAIAGRIAAWEGVEEVRFGKRWFEKGERLVRSFYIIDLVLGLIVFLSVIFVISNTVRLTIFNSRATIDILKLVGATNRYIEIPFIIEGALQGIVSSILAVGLLGVIHAFASRYIHDLVFIRLDAIALFVFLCALLGAVGSYAALRRFLRS
ncbi:MAG: ABC transporter permease [Candidatus Krumholzibacteriota bacterium]|nr:ABC transporter permease [Candidatus Krumholzibacteriota bacterium]